MKKKIIILTLLGIGFGFGLFLFCIYADQIKYKRIGHTFTAFNDQKYKWSIDVGMTRWDWWFGKNIRFANGQLEIVTEGIFTESGYPWWGLGEEK